MRAGWRSGSSLAAGFPGACCKGGEASVTAESWKSEWQIWEGKTCGSCQAGGVGQLQIGFLGCRLLAEISKQGLY